MVRDTFEEKIEQDVLSNGWKILLIDKKIKLHKTVISDHDVVVYKENKDTVIILEIQCKKEKVSSSFKFGKIDGLKSKFGFFSCNCDFMPNFREVDTTEQACFIDWIYDLNKKMVEREDKNPLNQLFECVIDTLCQIRDKPLLKRLRNKKVIIFPIIVYSDLKSKFYFIRLKPPEKFYSKMKDYVSEKYDAEIPQSDFPFLLIREDAFTTTDILSQLESYFTLGVL